MRKDLAERLTRDLLSFSGKLDQSVAELEGNSDEKFFQRYRRSVGQVMGVIYIEILRGVFLQYPELEPKSMRQGNFVVPRSALQLVRGAQELLSNLEVDLRNEVEGEELTRAMKTIEDASHLTQEIANLLRAHSPR